jgi:hypothetical protein
MNGEGIGCNKCKGMFIVYTTHAVIINSNRVLLLQRIIGAAINVAGLFSKFLLCLVF